MRTNFKYALFYDFHTLASNPDLGRDFNAAEFIAQIKNCGVDFLTVHARCNQGNAYYNTKIGKRHPSLQYDLIGEICRECRKAGITLSLYFNAHLSEEEFMANLEYMDVPLNIAERSSNKSTPFYHQSCYNSPFTEHLKDMALELAANYDFDGYFFDCIEASTCVCQRCTAEMKKLGYDPANIEDVRNFSEMSATRMCAYLTDEIRKVKPNALLFFNGRPFEDVSGMESHMECEVLPTSMWGYDCLPMLAHYLRTLGGDDRQVINMTGRFNHWGDFGGLRSIPALEFDLFYGIAHGMRPDIGSHMHPRGDMYEPVFDFTRELYTNFQRYDEWSLNAKNKVETAIVYFRHPRAYYPGQDRNTLRAAVRCFEEMKLQFDVVSEFVSWDKYDLLVFPDDVVFTEEITRRVEAHLAKGGKILATGASGLDSTGTKFAVKEWPAVFKAMSPYKPLFFQPSGKYAAGLPNMPLDLYAEGCSVAAAEGANAEMTLVKPYINKGWDGLRGNWYTPPQESTGEPFILEKGNIIYIAGKIFNGYHRHAPHQFRTLLANILAEFTPRPLLRTANLPSFARVALQEKGNYRMVHLMAYCPEKRCECMIVEDRITVVDGEIQIRLDDRPVSKVYLAPERTPLEFTVEDGYCKVTVPRFDGYTLLVLE